MAWLPAKAMAENTLRKSVAKKGGVQSSRAEAMESSLSNRLKADCCFEVKLVVLSHSKSAKRLRFSSGYFAPLGLAAGG